MLSIPASIFGSILEIKSLTHKQGSKFVESILHLLIKQLFMTQISTTLRYIPTIIWNITILLLMEDLQALDICLATEDMRSQLFKIDLILYD
jgi:hypothetical protein